MRFMKRKFFVLLFICLVCMTACHKTLSNMSKDSSDVKLYVEQLTSDDFNGRLTGTTGNMKAINFLEKQFKAIGLQPYKDDSYLSHYDHMFYDPEKSTSSMFVVFQNGETKTLKYGVDYLERLALEEISIEGELTFDIFDTELKQKVIMLDQENNIEKVLGTAKAIIVKVDNMKKQISVKSKGSPIIEMNESLYATLKQKAVKSITYKCEQKKEVIKAQNVVGKLSSNKDNDTAILISSHFDHVGEINKQIYYGAVDNASGVSVMLSVAKQLQNYMQKNALEQPFDILFCGFNGEDSGLQGSRAFAEEMKKRYKHVYVINLDVLGVKNDTSLLFIGDDKASLKLKQNLYNSLNAKGFLCNMDQSPYTSDHVSFAEQNIPAITIGQKAPDFIHTTKDTVEQIDFNLLEQISNNLSQYIIESVKSFVEAEINGKNEQTDKHEEVTLTPKELEKIKQINEIREKEQKSLQYDEYKIIEIDGIKHKIFNTQKQYTNIEDLEKDYSAIKTPPSIQDFNFKQASVIDNTAPVINDQTEINKIYKRKLDQKNISSLFLEYKKDDVKVLQLSLKQIVSEDHNRFDPSLKKVEIMIHGEAYYFLIDAENKICSVCKDFMIDNEKWQLHITLGEEKYISYNGKQMKGIKPDWFNNSEEEIKLFITKIEIMELIKKLDL